MKYDDRKSIGDSMEKIMIYVRALFQFLFVLIAGVSIGLCANDVIVRFQDPELCQCPELKLEPLPSKARAPAGRRGLR